MSFYDLPVAAAVFVLSIFGYFLIFFHLSSKKTENFDGWGVFAALILAKMAIFSDFWPILNHFPSKTLKMTGVPLARQETGFLVEK